ncbi:MAG: porin [Polyangiaceae bacterium]
MKQRIGIAAGFGIACLCALPGRAQAEETLLKPAEGWEIYTSGRVGAFAEVVDGTGVPAPKVMAHTPTNEGIPFDPTLIDPSGHVTAFRARSGFLGNVLNVGVRNHLTPNTLVTAQIGIWSTIESQGQRTYQKNLPDAREGYIKVEGPAGSLLVGRALSLFGRGATEIDFLYGHGYGVGAPQGFNDQGPTAGHIGFGVLANVFAAGVAYATPALAGFQLSVGYYDPAQLVGVSYRRTKLGRPEAEGTYDVTWGESNKVHVFVDGAFQKLYNTQPNMNDSRTVYGAQAGGRLELGAFHVGVAAFTGKGLGVNYFLSQSDSINNQASNEFRPFDGGYLQAQVSLTKWDFNAGIGITRAHQMSQDLDPTLNPGQPDYLKQQRGISAVVVYHFSKLLHGAFDYFRADTAWWGGETQGVNSVNLGMTATW